MPKTSQSATSDTTGQVEHPSLFDEGIQQAVARFGGACRDRFAVTDRAPEDQISQPIHRLLEEAATALGLPITLASEQSLAEQRVRPDFVAFRRSDFGVLGHIELKAPGKGANPNLFRGKHDQDQWKGLSGLPSVIYTDGNEWALYRYGELVADIVRLKGDVRTAGEALRAPLGFERLLAEFLKWQPQAPRSPKGIAKSIAGLCRMLRSEVEEMLSSQAREGVSGLSDVADGWRRTLFPHASDEEFADGYAQTVAFALLMARADGVSFTKPGPEGQQGTSYKTVEEIARELEAEHALMGQALRVMTDADVTQAPSTVMMLIRVISVIDWSKVKSSHQDPILYLYEDFLQEYDPELKKKTGSYYTPMQVVSGMTRFVDLVLRKRMKRRRGFAEKGVVTIDPAVGTGTFPLAIVAQAAETVRSVDGENVGPALESLARHLIGFELQMGAYSVAELRLSAALEGFGANLREAKPSLFVVDTLENPYPEDERILVLHGLEAKISQSRKRANEIKANQLVTVVIGNPPYGDKATGLGGWIEDRENPEGIARFRQEGNGVLEFVLNNLYVYFWRWATWKVFDTHAEGQPGIVCFITPRAFLQSEGMAGMRGYLRENADEGWIIDLATTRTNEKVFPGVKTEVCIAVFARYAERRTDVPAALHYTALTGPFSERVKALASLPLDGSKWVDLPTERTDPFTPAAGDEWASMPALADLMPWQAPGVDPCRTWVIAPEPETLKKRWGRLTAEQDDTEKKRLLKESRDSDLAKEKPDLLTDTRLIPLAHETGSCKPPVRIGYRPFDVQWIIPDARLIDMPRPSLWAVRSDHQIYLAEIHQASVTQGAPISCFAHVPSKHAPGAAAAIRPLLRGSDKDETANIAPNLQETLRSILGVENEISAEDILSYIVGVSGHAGFTERFREALVRRPGVRIPLTKQKDLWERAVDLGRLSLWLCTNGERLADSEAGRPPGPPRLPEGTAGPRVKIPIPTSPEGMPDAFRFDPDSNELHIGKGIIENVLPAVAEYVVGDMPVVRKWFGYRKASPSGRRSSPLDDVVPNTWTSEKTTDLLDLLHVLTQIVELEDRQRDLLEDILEKDLVSIDDLTVAGVLPVPESMMKAPAVSHEKSPTLF